MSQQGMEDGAKAVEGGAADVVAGDGAGMRQSELCAGIRTAVSGNVAKLLALDASLQQNGDRSLVGAEGKLLEVIESLRAPLTLLIAERLARERLQVKA